MSARFGSYDERGRTRCPRCYGTKAQDLGRRLYRCMGDCHERGLRPGEREYRIRADEERARTRAVQRERDDRARMAGRYETWADRWATRPRTKGHRVLRLSPATRAAWNGVRAAKRHDSFERRGNEFLRLLWHDLHDVPKGEREPLRIVCKGWNRYEEDRGTWTTGAPTLRLVSGGSNLGTWKRSLFDGHWIEIATGTRRRGEWVRLTLDEMRDTFVHEVQHWMDSVAGFDDESHGRRWAKRLAELRRILPPAERAAPRRRHRRAPARKAAR